MSATLRYTEVFVAGGFPKHTYNPRPNYSLETRVLSAKDNLCKLITVTGQTKSGKTVLVRKIFPPSSSVWIDGGMVGEESDFWDNIVQQLEIFQESEVGAEQTQGAELEGKAKMGGGFIPGEIETGGRVTDGKASSTKQARKVSSKVAAISGLRVNQTPIIIDDFHYLSKELQCNVVRALKQPIFDGLPVLLIAIPHRRYDAVRVEKEMSGRLFSVEVPVWQPDELQFIPVQGFTKLEAMLPDEIVERMVVEAIGSPHLMQDFCRETCHLLELLGIDLKDSISLEVGLMEKVFQGVANQIGRPIFEKLARGPRPRSDRLPRQLKSGRITDIYGLVLQALAHLRPGLVTLEYEQIRSAIREVSADEVPQLQEVSRVLKHMSEISAKDESSTAVIDFDDENKVLHVTDPFFAFYLRWGDLDQGNQAPDAESNPTAEQEILPEKGEGPTDLQ